MKKEINNEVIQQCRHECQVMATTNNTIAHNCFTGGGRTDEEYTKLTNAIERSRKYWWLGTTFERLEDKFNNLYDEFVQAVNEMNQLNIGE